MSTVFSDEYGETLLEEILTERMSLLDVPLEYRAFHIALYFARFRISRNLGEAEHSKDMELMERDIFELERQANYLKQAYADEKQLFKDVMRNKK